MKKCHIVTYKRCECNNKIEQDRTINEIDCNKIEKKFTDKTDKAFAERISDNMYCNLCKKYTATLWEVYQR